MRALLLLGALLVTVGAQAQPVDTSTAASAGVHRGSSGKDVPSAQGAPEGAQGGATPQAAAGPDLKVGASPDRVPAPFEALDRLRARLATRGRPEQVLQELSEIARRYVPVEEVEGLTDPLTLLVVVLLSAAIARSARKLRGHLLRSGVIPRLLLLVSIAGRFLALFAGVLAGLRLAPHWLGAAVPWVLLAGAMAVGWSLRDVFPDLIAGLVVISERRVRPGAWVTGEGFSGAVDRLGPRAALLYTASGQRVSLPNRQLLTAPVVFRAGVGAHHEAELVVEAALPAAQLRRAIEEAAASSPWVALRPELSVERDSVRAELWRVRVRLLDLRYAPRFDGELLERTEEALAVEPEG